MVTTKLEDALIGLLRELVDIEGPQPGNSQWALKVQHLLAKIDEEEK